jgi:hypothetical protein
MSLHQEFIPGVLPRVDEEEHFREPNIAMWGEMAAFIKSHIKLQSLRIHIGGWLPEEASWRG